MHTDRLQAITTTAEVILKEAARLQEYSASLDISGEEVTLEDTDVLKHSVVEMAQLIATIGPNIRAMRAHIGSTRKRK